MVFLYTAMSTPVRILTALLLAAVVLAGFSQPAFAGFCRDFPDPGTRHEYQFLAGYSPGSTTLVGKTEDRQFLQAGFAYSYRCWRVGGVTVSPTATILPLANVFQPEYSVGGRRIPPHAVYGLSVLPLGFTLDGNSSGRLGPFGETHGGIIVSAERIPVDRDDATRLNFIFDLGGGLRWQPGGGYAFRMGYRFVHISNGDTIGFNPGLDNNVLYASFSLLR